MEYKLPSILIAIPVFAVFFFICMSLSSRRHQRKLTEALTRLYQGNLHAFEDFHFLDTQVNQLYFPFTEAELRQIGRCREFNHCNLTVELMYKPQAFWGNYYFHISCDYEGVNDQYQLFSLQREGYLYISCSDLRGHWLPCITHVERRSKPFLS